MAQWDTVKTELEAAKEVPDEAEAAEALSMGALEKASMTLHEATKQALGLAKVRFRNTPETLKAFTGLQAKKTSLATTRRNTYSDLTAWYAAATRVFPLGTETGALARAQIPT